MKRARPRHSPAGATLENVTGRISSERTPKAGRHWGVSLVQAEIAETAQQRVEGDLPLHPGERRADAEVSAVAEAEVRVGMAPDVEALRIGELRRITIGRGEHAHDLLARLDGLAAEVEIGGRGPHHELERRLVAERLLDGRTGQAGVLVAQAPLIGIAQDVEHAAADRIHCGLVAAVQQEHALRQDLDLAQRARRLLLGPGPEQPSDQIVAGRAAVILHDRAHEIRHLLHRVAQGGDRLRVAERSDGEIQRDGVDPALEAFGVVARRAQQLGDYPRRQPQGEVGHQIHLPPSLGRVDQSVGDPLHPPPKLLDQAGGEGAGQGLADPPVLRVVLEQGPAPQQLVHGSELAAQIRGELRRLRVAGAGGGEPFVQQGRFDVRVARQHPTAEQLTPIDRRGLAHAPVVRIRVRVPGEVERILLDGQHEGSGHRAASSRGLEDDVSTVSLI